MQNRCRMTASVSVIPGFFAPAMISSTNGGNRDAATSSVDAAMPPIMSSRHLHLRARKIWIDDALGSAARCRLGALRQRGIAAFDEALFVAVELQADRIVRTIRLGPSRRRRQNRRDRQSPKCLSHCALGFRLQADRPPCFRSIHVHAFGMQSFRRIATVGSIFRYSTLAPRCRSASICSRVPPPNRAR
jgi:hypothetical protein